MPKTWGESSVRPQRSFLCCNITGGTFKQTLWQGECYSPKCCFCFKIWEILVKSSNHSFLVFLVLFFLISLSPVEIKHMASLHNMNKTCTGMTSHNWWVVGLAAPLQLWIFGHRLYLQNLSYFSEIWINISFTFFFYLPENQQFFVLVWRGPGVKGLSHNALLHSTWGSHFTNRDLKWRPKR